MTTTSNLSDPAYSILSDLYPVNANASTDLTTVASLLSSIQTDNLDAGIEALRSLQEARREELKRKDILKQYDIKQIKKGKNAGIWYTQFEGKKMQSMDRKKLEDKLVSRVKESEVDRTYSLRRVYEIEQEKQLKRVTDPIKRVSKQNTVLRHDSTFRKYIVGSAIENMPVKKISDLDLEDFLISVNDPPIKVREMNNLLGILNQTFRRAKKLKLINNNPLEYVDLDDFYESCLDIAPVGERAYSNEQMQSLYFQARRYQKENPENSAAWAYELCLLMAPRRGEIPPLEWDDVDFQNRHIIIRKQLIQNGKTSETVIKPQPKNRKTRCYPITTMIQAFLERLLERNRTYYPDVPYLFPNPEKPHGIIRLHDTYDFHRMLCKSLEIPINKNFIKGPHAFRRTHESEILNSGGSKEMAGRVYGNTPRTIAMHYEMTAESKAAAPYIEKLQKELFSLPEEPEKSEKIGNIEKTLKHA